MGPIHRKMHSNGRFELKPPASWWCDHPAKLGHHQLLKLRFNSPKQSPSKKKTGCRKLGFLSSLNQNRIQPPVLSARRFQCSCREEFQTSRSKDPNEFSQSDLSRHMKGPCAMAFHSFFMVCKATFFTRISTHLCAVCTVHDILLQVYQVFNQEFAWIPGRSQPAFKPCCFCAEVLIASTFSTWSSIPASRHLGKDHCKQPSKTGTTWKHWCFRFEFNPCLIEIEKSLYEFE